MASYIRLATLLHLPEYDEPDQSKVKPAVQRWLNKHTGWLLILDNIEDLNLVDQFVPVDRQGAVLLTTRQQATEPIAQALELGPLPENDGILFLLKRTKKLTFDLSLDSVPARDVAEARTITRALGNLPLALDQAGAYILETRCALPDYLELFRKHQAELLRRRAGREIPIDHPLSVNATFALNFQQVQQRNKGAAELLRFLAFLHPDAIPEEIITRGASELGPVLRPVAHDLMKLNEAIAELLMYSLVRRDRTAHVFQIHRLVQAVLKHEMNKQTQQKWAERTVRAIERAFPDPGEFEMWELCERCLPHALACAELIRDWEMEFNEAARLLNDAGGYLNDHARYVEAEPLYQQALEIGEKTLGTEHPSVALRLNNLASLYADQGKFEQAEPLYQRSLAIVEKALGPEDPGLATTLNNLAILYRLQGRYEQAAPLLQRALSIDEKTLGPEHPGFAMDLNNLAVLYLFQGKFEEATPLLQQALRINEKALGREHPNVALNLNSLAIIYHKEGRHEEAEPLLQRALAIGEKALGANHPQVARYLDNYAVLLRETNRETEATELQVRAQAIRAKSAQEN
jgi:tetratricopeptide (TPR) repeat protein